MESYGDFESLKVFETAKKIFFNRGSSIRTQDAIKINKKLP